MAMKPSESLVDLRKSLGPPARLRILARLRGGELCLDQDDVRPVQKDGKAARTIRKASPERLCAQGQPLRTPSHV
jgi:hypothetical protein